MKFAKIIAVSFLILLSALLFLQKYHTAGEYEAKIFYEKVGDHYVLRGVKIEIDSAKISGEYQLELSYSKTKYSKISDPLSPEKRKELFGVVSYDSRIVKISWRKSENSIVYTLSVRPEEVLRIEEKESLRKYVDCNNSLILREPIKFSVVLTPVSGGWVVRIEEVEVVKS